LEDLVLNKDTLIGVFEEMFGFGTNLGAGMNTTVNTNF
jgi:hypothetical protein